jgi:hypothetical protein
MNSDIARDDENKGGPFVSARVALDSAEQSRTELAACWAELRESGCIGASVLATTPGRGRLDVTIWWPTRLRNRFESAAANFARDIKRTLDEALFATACVTLGDKSALDPHDYRVPLCDVEENFVELMAGNTRLSVLRPDQVDAVRSVQPFALTATEPGGVPEKLANALRQLRQLLEPPPNQRLIAIWAHSARPTFDSPDAGAEIVGDVLRDGVLETSHTVATFTCTGTDAARVRANPMIAFDLVFNAEPLPRDPDDNLMARSSLLLAFAREFVRGMQRSTQVDNDDHPAYATRMPIMARSPWGEVDVASTPDGTLIDEALDQSDLGVGVHTAADGTTTVLLLVDGVTFGRPIPAAIELDPEVDPGTAAEDACRSAASFWGLPDFVMRPAVVRKGRASREAGDGTIVVGSRALAIQVKHRMPAAGNNATAEIGRIIKRIDTGARQASGSIRSLSNGSVPLVNGRARTVGTLAPDLEWCRVVILDHPSAPEVTIPGATHPAVPLVVLLRRDWDFLFDQLRSLSAVVDYLFRVAGDDDHTLGAESARYYRLAKADESALLSRHQAEWAKALEIPTFSQPALPLVPPSSLDAAGATVYRLILEDIAESPIDSEEHVRLWMLGLLDRYPVIERAVIGRLLLGQLDGVARLTEETRWHFRTTTLDEGTLQLAFGVCSMLSEMHREAFRQWAMLRHHDLCERQQHDADRLSTVAVLLTPRWNGGARLWDTTTVALNGALDLEHDELEQMRELWNRRSAA